MSPEQELEILFNELHDILIYPDQASERLVEELACVDEDIALLVEIGETITATHILDAIERVRDRLATLGAA